MQLAEKSKSGLMKEIGELQNRLAELEKEKAEHQRIAKEKHRLLKRNQLMMRKALDGIVTVDLNGDILDANPAFCEMHKFSREELLKMNISDLQVDTLEFSRNQQDALNKTGLKYEVKHRDREGNILYLEASTAPVRFEGTMYFYTFFRDVTGQKKAVDRMRTYQQQLRSLASELTLAEERERHRIATQLHDRIGQGLAGIKMQLEIVAYNSGSEYGSDQLRHILNQLAALIRETRTLTFEVSPPVLYELGLKAALEWLCEKFEEKHSIEIRYRLQNLPREPETELNVFIFSAARELLLNVIKHAKAHKVRVTLEQEGDRIFLKIKDDGQGLKIPEPHSAPEGFGLFSIRERLNYLGGKFSIRSAPGQGTDIALSIPLSR
ncbi:MAG TPA: PAS domain-containing sensor histidine kinase [Caldithrix sp.]|nr:PAS domain-containing sensor histidine kinase [Caldithrix sp.]